MRRGDLVTIAIGGDYDEDFGPFHHDRADLIGPWNF